MPSHAFIFTHYVKPFWWSEFTIWYPCLSWRGSFHELFCWWFLLFSLLYMVIFFFKCAADCKLWALQEANMLTLVFMVRWLDGLFFVENFWYPRLQNFLFDYNPQGRLYPLPGLATQLWELTGCEKAQGLNIPQANAPFFHRFPSGAHLLTLPCVPPSSETPSSLSCKSSSQLPQRGRRMVGKDFGEPTAFRLTFSNPLEVLGAISFRASWEFCSVKQVASRLSLLLV